MLSSDCPAFPPRLQHSGCNINLPSPLPTVAAPVHMRSPVLYRYYMNVCTASYSMAWWDWDRWQFEIDWMAMNGINLPLSFTGQARAMRGGAREREDSTGDTQSPARRSMCGPRSTARWG